MHLASILLDGYFCSGLTMNMQWSDMLNPGKVMTVPSAEDYTLKILDRGTNPLSSYPDCASMTAASFQPLILQNKNLCTEGEKTSHIAFSCDLQTF